ncbi:MAG TPA: T9SS type A sorting domain-containing protein [Ignavibacteria bacterium]
MRFKTFLIFVFLFYPFLSHSQYVYKWYELPSGTTQNLNSVVYDCAVGNNGTALFYVYPGVWNISQTGTSENIFSVNNISSTFYVTGSNGLLMKTTSSGSNWYVYNTQTSNNLYSFIRIIKRDSVTFQFRLFVCGANGTLKYSNLLGSDSSWHNINPGISNDLKSFSNFNLSVLQANQSIICGSGGLILKSTNGGDNWSVKNTGITDNLNSVQFSDSSFGLAGGDNGRIIKSTDGGESWTILNSQTNNNLNSVMIFGYYGNAYAAGDNGTLRFTTNGGVNWLPESIGQNVDINSINYSSPRYFAVGNNGKIFLKTLDSLYQFFSNLDPNRISSILSSGGIFNQNGALGNLAGFRWPKDSNKTAIFTSGLTIAGYINSQFRMMAGSFKGECYPGHCINGNYLWDSTFRIYKVSRTDNPNTSYDWAHWGSMVPYGAPFVDVNQNGIYEPLVDTPGVRKAEQTIFICMTDANPSSHNYSESFGGGTSPLGAEIHLTAWGYDKINLKDIQFIKWEIINKSPNSWNSTYFSVFCDPDVGDGSDDYMGCDSIRNLSYGYNADNNDFVYGYAPPAVGFRILKTPFTNTIPSGISSLIKIGKSSSGGVSCESEPYSDPPGAYNYMKGLKKDSTPWVIPNTNPPQITKFCYSGDPETGAGWTAYNGYVGNCGGSLYGTTYNVEVASDKRYLMSMGGNNFTVNPGDTQTIIMAQLIARGTNNLNSVTRLKQLSDTAFQLYQGGFVIGVKPLSSLIPDKFLLYQNYPNPFNPTTKIRFEIPLSKGGQRELYSSLKVYDILGKEITTLINEKLNPGVYEADFDGSNFASGVYFYQLRYGDFVQMRKMILLK